jgi:hypothetical protein
LDRIAETAARDVLTERQRGAGRARKQPRRPGRNRKLSSYQSAIIRTWNSAITLWIIGAAFLAAGSLLIGYSLGLKAGERKSNLAKDLRILRKEKQIARLEKALKKDASPQPNNDGDCD